MEVNGCAWDFWVEEALSKLQSLKVLRSLRPIHLSAGVSRRSTSTENSPGNTAQESRLFDGPNTWDRASVEVEISEPTFQKWLHDIPSSGTVRFFRLVSGLSFHYLNSSFFRFHRLNW